ncbi:hypothetical protein NARC_10355 [Candidatus Nitrosocosmicus arcticus]|uniref:Uncharacterized protein n=1 Tax=Candidatus Nitrosocosmicus arcticus TaxID=2035267 RepID=A0A557SZB5_9ARCH|nr:hypothetical protein NARC_10355 [Candidatus Nitrosocosmicus arcticus]
MIYNYYSNYLFNIILTLTMKFLVRVLFPTSQGPDMVNDSIFLQKDGRIRIQYKGRIAYFTLREKELPCL